jgi:polar amino acid transport system permease protein
MSYRTKMRRIILPQAIRVIIPPTGNEFIAMLKDSALAYTIGVLELFRQADLAGRRDFRGLEAYLLAAMGYWVLTGIFSFFQARLERRMGRGYVRGGDARGGGGPAPPSAGAQPGMVGSEVAPVAGQGAG